MTLYNVLAGLSRRGLLNWMSDKLYIKIAYRARFHKKINLKDPTTFNEKLQWLKLHDRKPEYTKLVDKYTVKEIIGRIIGNEYIIPTIGLYNTIEDINIEELPNNFVVKCTHDSGSVVVVKNKKQININEIRKKINKGLRNNGYQYGREWPYKNVKPRIIIEKDISIYGEDLKDYKLFVFGGKVRYYKIDFNRFVKHQANYYDRNGKLQEFGEKAYPPDFNKKITTPKNINKMITLAEKIAKGMPFVRIDFYSIKDKIYFGEVTLYPAAGFGKITPDEWDYRLGKLITLPLKKRKTT